VGRFFETQYIILQWRFKLLTVLLF